jgi:hypothetical protein
MNSTTKDQLWNLITYQWRVTKSGSNLKLFFNEKTYSKFNISITLGLKITKSPPRNPFIQGL